MKRGKHSVCFSFFVWVKLKSNFLILDTNLMVFYIWVSRYRSRCLLLPKQTTDFALGNGSEIRSYASCGFCIVLLIRNFQFFVFCLIFSSKWLYMQLSSSSLGGISLPRISPIGSERFFVIRGKSPVFTKEEHKKLIARVLASLH